MLDAIIISDSGTDTYSASSPLRLQIDGKVALIQHVRNFMAHQGHLVPPVQGENERNWHAAPKLNGIRLYSHLLADGFTTALIDSYYQERERFRQLLDENPRAVIISTTFILDKADLKRLVDDIRSLAPDIIIMAGGPFVYSSYLLLQRAADKDYDVESPRDDFLFLNADHRPEIDLYIVDKSGLQVLSQALQRVKDRQPVDDLPNIARWDGDAYVFAERTVLPPPDAGVAWRRLPQHIFTAATANIQASIGCPFHCEFCNFVKDAKYTFVKPLDLLIRELKEISARGVRYVRFVDDNFRLGRDDLNDVCRRFVREGLGLKWMSFLRASTLARADFDLLKQAGCLEVQIGVESADETVLRNMNKNADPAMYRRVISGLLDSGINCSCCFVVGFPGETTETFQRTLDFINDISGREHEGIFSWSIYPFLLVPLSPIYAAEKRSRYGLKGYMHRWEHHTMNSRRAMELTLKAFCEIDSAGPIYSGDNIDMLLELSPRKRKEFMRVRHRLSKLFLQEPFDRNRVYAEFSKVFA